MFRAPVKPTHEQSGFISRRLGFGLILMVGLAGAVSAAYFLSAPSTIPAPSAAAGLQSSLTGTSSTALQEPHSTVISAAVAGTPSRATEQNDHAVQPALRHGSGDAQTSRVAVATGGIEPVVASGQAAAEPVLHITNQGDQIILSYDQTPGVDLPSGGSSGQAASPGTSSATEDSLSNGAEEGSDPESEQLSEYTEVYPGCPRALPFGSDKSMAQQMRSDYGCVYLRSCTSRNDEVTEGSCTWYLTGKVSS